MRQTMLASPSAGQAGWNGQLASARRGGAQGQYLTFLVGTDMFAIDVLGIREIIEDAGVTSVPMMPPFVRGIINLRGAVVPVIDLPARLHQQPASRTRKSCIVVVEVASDDQDDASATHQVLGLVVDAVHAVLDIGIGEIAPAPPFGARIRSDFIAGIAKLHERTEGKFVMLLNLEAVVAIDDPGIASVSALPHQAPRAPLQGGPA